MAAFGIDPALLVVDEAELARLRASTRLPDFRQAGNLERELGNKQENLRDAEARLTEASRAVVELLGELKSVEAAHKRLEKVGGSPAKLAQKMQLIREALENERRREAQLTAIVASLKSNIAQFLAEGPKDGPTNGELISSSREREQALKAAGL
jgi:chromosome segregation ATPase